MPSLNLFITTPLRYLPIPWQFFCKIRLSRPVWERQNVLATILSLLLWPKNYRLGRTGPTGEPRKTYFSQYEWYLFLLQVSMSRGIRTLLLSCNTKLPQVSKSQNRILHLYLRQHDQFSVSSYLFAQCQLGIWPWFLDDDDHVDNDDDNDDEDVIAPVLSRLPLVISFSTAPRFFQLPRAQPDKY